MMNEYEALLNKLTKALLIIIFWGCIVSACYIWYCDYITKKAYKRGLNEVPGSMQRVINQTRESDSLAIKYFLEHSNAEEKSIARGFLVYLKSVKELER